MPFLGKFHYNTFENAEVSLGGGLSGSLPFSQITFRQLPTYSQLLFPFRQLPTYSQLSFPIRQH